MHRSRFFRRRSSLPFLCANSTTSDMHSTKKLSKNHSLGSVLSIYDDESFSSTSSEDSSSQTSYAANMLTHGEYSYLSCYPWYIGRLNRLDAENYLEGMRDGTYLVRQSEAQSDYTHAICIRWKSKPFHVRLYRSAGMYSISVGNCAKFSSIEELVSHFQEHSLVCNYPAINTVLKHPYREELARIELEALSSEDYADEFSESDDSSTQTPPEGERIVDACKPLDDQPWYHRRLSRSGSEALLADQPNFSFLVRDSESIAKGYSLSIRDEERGFVHLKILQQNGGYVLGQYSHTFRTIPECIAYYCEHKLNIKDSVHQSLKKPVLRC